MMEHRSQRYTAIVWRQFRKSRLAVVCLLFVAALILMAVLAPVLANDRPVIMRHEGKW